ncbi:MAG: hypothetical protein JKY04_04160 [Sneathiella sp.]|nr:hypothetical protein [Sneathiella sp.]
MPTVILDIADVVDELPNLTDQSLIDDFVSVASILIQQEKDYAPNPGKTKYNTDYIKNSLPQLNNIP